MPHVLLFDFAFCNLLLPNRISAPPTSTLVRNGRSQWPESAVKQSRAQIEQLFTNYGHYVVQAAQKCNRCPFGERRWRLRLEDDHGAVGGGVVFQAHLLTPDVKHCFNRKVTTSLVLSLGIPPLSLCLPAEASSRP